MVRCLTPYLLSHPEILKEVFDIVAKSKSTALISAADIERALAPLAKQHAAAVASAEPTYGNANIIRTKNKNFSLNEAKVQAPLLCVVIGASFVQNYYDGAYNPDELVPPVCFARSLDDKALAADPASPKRQHDGPCLTCPHNRPGTGEKGGWTRACQGRRRLALLGLSDKSEDPVICTIEVSSGGLKAWTKYVTNVATVHGLPYYLAVTALDFKDTEKDTWFVDATFKGLLSQSRTDWLQPGKGVRVGDEGWLETTLVGRKMKEVAESKILLSVPQAAPAGTEQRQGKKPVTGAKRVAVKDAKRARAAK